MTRFAKFALSGLTALSITLAPLPSAAAPDAEDVAKTIAGLAVLGIIANHVNDRDRKRSTTTTVTSGRTPYSSIERHDDNRVIEGRIRRPDDKWNNGRWNNGRDVRKARLPDQCLLIVEGNRRDRLVYGQRCLSRNYVYANHLPDTCRLTVRDGNRKRTVYGARCLSRDGWRVAGR